MTREHAASMGPGSFDPGNVVTFVKSFPHLLASMGPGSFDPGNRRNDTMPTTTQWLQWGRGLLTPEMPRRRSHPGLPVHRFNGAGVF